MRGCVFFVPAAAGVLAATLSVRAGIVYDYQVRDAVGGENSYGHLGGVYLTGTGSRPVGTPSDGPIRAFPVGTYDFEIRSLPDGGWAPFRTYGLYPFAPLGFGLNPQDDVGAGFSVCNLHDLEDIPSEEGGKGIAPNDQRSLEVLWANAYDTSLTGRAPSAAFQLLIWEYVWDREVDFTKGNVRLINSGYTADVRHLAETWAQNISDGTWTTRTPLSALCNPCAGELLLPVPSPGAIGLVLVAVPAMFGWRRRR